MDASHASLDDSRNLATLLDVEPKQLSDWFHECFIDAFDWVVEPNVLGMASASMGTTMMTKPYISGTPYINKMSDYCQSCALDPKELSDFKFVLGFLRATQKSLRGESPNVDGDEESQ